MKVTAKLALSQLKVNRSRTAGAVTAIALSAALITTVCLLVVSGNRMLTELLGEHYGEYGAAYKGLLLVPAILLGILILAMAVIVISNVFRVSAAERVEQFGILKCVGTTRRQIRESVMYESMMLCAVGIPAGLLLGLALTFAGIGAANHFLSRLDSLVNVMIVEIHLSLSFVFSWQALLFSAVLCFVTVLLSAWTPASRAAKTSAIDCIRGTGEVKLERDKLRTSPIVERLFGFEGTLAAKNLKRSRRNFRSTVITLSVGAILFIGLGELSGQAKAMEEYMHLDIEQTVIAEYSSAHESRISSKTGKKETRYSNPIDSKLGDALTLKLEEFDGGDIFGTGADRERYFTTVPEEYITAQMRQAITRDAEEAAELPVEIITVDTQHYAQLCKKAGVAEGAVILLDHYSYNDNGSLVHLTPFSKELKALTLTKADGSQTEITIGGVLTQEEMPRELFYLNTNPVRLILPEAQVRDYAWLAAPEDISGFTAYANQLLSQTFPEAEGAEYMESGFSTRVYEADDYMRVMNIAIVLASFFMYSFAALLMLIGFTNVISTLYTNVKMRTREFAVLRSVGMAREGIEKMLALESILCSAKALMYALPIGLIISYLINLPIRAMFPIPYELPWLPTLICAAAVFLITWGTTRYAVGKLDNRNIMESIRRDG